MFLSTDRQGTKSSSLFCQKHKAGTCPEQNELTGIWLLLLDAPCKLLSTHPWAEQNLPVGSILTETRGSTCNSSKIQTCSGWKTYLSLSPLCPSQQLHSKLGSPELILEEKVAPRWCRAHPQGHSPFPFCPYWEPGAFSSPAITQNSTLPQKWGLSWRWTDQQESCTVINFSFHKELCRNTCMYLQVSSGPFVRKAGSSNRLQRAGSHSNLKRKKCIKYKNNASKPSGIFLSVKKLIRHTWASHVLGSPSGFVSGHTSCSLGSTELWELTGGKRRQSCSLLGVVFSWKRTQKSLEAML